MESFACFDLMALLQSLSGSTPNEYLSIDADRTVLGRHPECDIVLDSAAVSRQHAQIICEGADYFVEDLHSRNGTYVNGQPVQGRRHLQDGDRLRICELAFIFFSREPSSESVELATTGTSRFPRLPELHDDEPGKPMSTVMDKLELTSGRSGIMLSVNPEAKLRAMIEISQSLGKAVALDEVLPKLLDSLFKIFPQADRGFIVLRNGPGGPLVPRAMRHRREHMEERVRISRTILDQVVTAKEAILSADAGADARFETSQSIADLRIRSVMCAPLIDSEGNVLGVLQIDTMDARHRFRQDDLEMLASVASQAAQAVDNAQLHENALRQHAVNRDLELAHRVQRSFLPAAPPTLADYFFFDFYESANQVGGDYYDYVELPGGRLAVVLGDVSGKGVSAALLMAKLSGEVRYCLAAEPDPGAAVSHINASFCRSGWDDRFVTFILAVVDARRNEIAVVNAGHMSPFLRDGKGRVETLDDREAGLPLGVDAGYRYAQCTRTVLPGDCFVMYTDGINEAMNAQGELYGIERLRASGAAGRQHPKSRAQHSRRRSPVRRRPGSKRRHVPSLLRAAWLSEAQAWHSFANKLRAISIRHADVASQPHRAQSFFIGLPSGATTSTSALSVGAANVFRSISTDPLRVKRKARDKVSWRPGEASPDFKAGLVAGRHNPFWLDVTAPDRLRIFIEFDHVPPIRHVAIFRGKIAEILAVRFGFRQRLFD